VHQPSSLLPGDSARGGGAKLLDRSRPEARFRKPTAVWSVASLPGREIRTIRERISYVRPEGLLRGKVADLLHECRPTPAIVNGINAATAMHGLDLSKHFA
jgi:hypothetical protein